MVLQKEMKLAQELLLTLPTNQHLFLFPSIKSSSNNGQWKVNNREGELLATHHDPIQALHSAARFILHENPATIIYFDLHATQTIRYFETLSPSEASKILVSIMERKGKQPLIRR